MPVHKILDDLWAFEVYCGFPNMEPQVTKSFLFFSPLNLKVLSIFSLCDIFNA